MARDGFVFLRKRGPGTRIRWGNVATIAFSMICGVLAAGCCSDGGPKGTIYLDHGEVFTRERLVNERLNNYNWLTTELNNTPLGGTLQGGRYRSESTSLSGQISAQVNPLGAVSPLGQQSIQSSAQAAQLQGQIQVAALQQEYNALQSNAISYTNLLNPNGLTGASPASPSFVSSSNAVPVVNIINTAAGPNNATLGPANNLAFPSTIQLTSVEQFQDQLAYRDAVSDEIHEQELDDTHDDHGMTLYTINFHLSVAPGESNNYFGRVSASFSECTNDFDPDELFDDWFASFEKTFDQSVVSIQRRYLQNFLSDDEIRDLILDEWASQRYAADWIGVESNSPSAALVECNRSFALLTDITSSFASVDDLKDWLRVNTNQIQTFMDLDDLVSAITNDFSQDQFDLLTNVSPQRSKSEKPLSTFQMLESNQFQKVFEDDNFLTAATQSTPEAILSISNALADAIMRQYEWKTNVYNELTEELNDLDAVVNNGLMYKKNHTTIDQQDDLKVMKALCWVVWDEFHQLNESYFHQLVKIGFPRLTHQSNQDYAYLMEVSPGNSAHEAFREKMEHLNTRAARRTFVYAIEPKEYAQNLMDESDKQNSLTLALGLSAAIPQISTSLSAYLQYMRQNQYILETIKRRPLLTAFMDGTTNFGWLMGGRFKISPDYELTYEQVAVQEAVQVTLELPAWWSAVKVNTKSQWLQRSGQAFNAGQSNSEIIDLKPDYAAVTRALMEEQEPDYARPEIYPTWDPNQNNRGYVVQAGLPAQLLILGKNLWRNAVVFIGSQSTVDTYNYNVLPDMQGIVATFPSIAQPATLSTNAGQPVTADLRVVTSDGEAVLRDGVTIESVGSVGPAGGFIKMTNSFSFTGSNITFNVSPNLPGTSTLALYLLALSPWNAKPQPLCSNMISNGTLTFQIPTNASQWPTPSGHLDVWMQATSNGEPVSVLQGGEQAFVVFTNISQSQFAFGSTNVAFSAVNNSASPSQNNTLTIEAPPGVDQTSFWSARPGLQNLLQISSGKIQIQLSNGTASGGAMNLNYGTFDGTNIQFQLVTAANIQPITNGLSIANGGQATCTGVIKVPVNSPQFTVPISGTINLIRKD